jgi:FtsP/CotA-like multicopper oxidase with cupredoxin domain
VHLYHCHANPLKRHVHKGLYGAFIIDPPATSPRPPADEMVIVLNAFDTNFDAENEVYAANTVASFYVQEPIRVQVGQLVRMYVVNLTEFDLINSMHLHGMFFDVFKTGTSMTPSESTDTIMLCQGERAILETTFRYPGEFMFHAHQSEFAELGWMGLFRAEARSAA